MRPPLRKLLSLVTASSLAMAMLTAATSDCAEMATSTSVASGQAADDMHDCGDPAPAAPVPSHHDCRMMASCASVALSARLSVDIGRPVPPVRPVALDDARPRDVVPALVAPPPRA